MEFPKDINGKTVKVGDKIKGFGYISFASGNFRIDRTPIVTVGIDDGVLYFGGLSAKSFSRFEIVKEVLDE
jgi:hypothetical protein